MITGVVEDRFEPTMSPGKVSVTVMDYRYISFRCGNMRLNNDV